MAVDTINFSNGIRVSTKATAIDRTTDGYIIGQALVKGADSRWKPDFSFVTNKMWLLNLVMMKLDLASKKDADKAYMNLNSFGRDMQEYFKIVKKSRKGQK